MRQRDEISSVIQTNDDSGPRLSDTDTEKKGEMLGLMKQNKREKTR